MTTTENDPDRDLTPASGSFTVGDVRFTVIGDGPLALGPAHVCFPELTPDEALAEFGADQAAELRLDQNLLVAEVGGARILFETGLGPTYTGPVGRDASRAPANLHAAGVDPGSIDLIALSHAHFDHVGGLVEQDGSAAFAHAEVVLSRAEYDDVMVAPGGRRPGIVPRPSAGLRAQLSGAVQRPRALP